VLVFAASSPELVTFVAEGSVVPLLILIVAIS
jgi:hypothetical protein